MKFLNILTCITDVDDETVKLLDLFQQKSTHGSMVLTHSDLDYCCGVMSDGLSGWETSMAGGKHAVQTFSITLDSLFF